MTNYVRAFYYLRTMMRRAFWDRGRLDTYRNRKLKAMIAYAFENSRFYHDKFKEVGVRPEDIRTVADLSKLPVVRKEELKFQAERSNIISRQFRTSDLLVQRTSGSTGRPLNIYITGAENEFRKAKHLRAQIALGQRAWDRWVTITSPLHFAETTKLQRLLRVYGVYPVSVFDDVAVQASRIVKLKPDVIDGYSNSVLLLAKEVKKKGLKSIKPRFLVSGAELIDSGSRKFVEEVFDVPFYDQYASVEFERLAWQCREKNGYHIDADSVIMQFVDENGEDVSLGEKGEVVCTSLFNLAMPFIRYGLDDVGVPSENDDCNCGRSFPLMKVIEGRKTSLLTFPSGRVLAPFAFMLAVWTFNHYDRVDMFRVVQRRKDLLVFKIKLKAGVVAEKALERELVEHLRKTLQIPAEEVEFAIEFVDEIPLGKTGKFSIVVSEIGQPSIGS